MRPVSLTIVFPAFNEEEGIARSIEEATAELTALVDESVIDGFEILVVDDGSTDSTADVVSVNFGRDPRVRLLRHQHNRGVGAVLRTALEAATGDVVLSTDADMPVHLGVLRSALPLLARPNTGLVAGQRADFDAEPLIRRFASRTYDRFAQCTLGTSTRDVNFPFKLMQLDAARSLSLRSEGALIDVELLTRVHASGASIATLVMQYRSRQFGTSKTMSIRLLRRMAIDLLHNHSSIRAANKRLKETTVHTDQP